MTDSIKLDEFGINHAGRDFVITQMVDLGPTGKRSGTYWIVSVGDVKIGRKFHTNQTAIDYLPNCPKGERQ